jgi:hypothetical protein
MTTALVCALGGGAGALLGGCGSGGTKTVTVPDTTSTSSQATPTTTAATTTAAATTPSATPSGGTAAPSGTRTAPAPAFVAPGSSAQDLAGAVAVVRSHGYQPYRTSDYHPDQTLRVLVGTGSGPHDFRAFFFVNGRYIGTDTARPSATVTVAGQSDTAVTLAYSLFRPNDALCCPSGGVANVRFQLDNGHLVPLDPIPSASSTAPLSRE